MLDVLAPAPLRPSTTGSAEDGKSTLVGRLMCDTKSIMQDQLDAARAAVALDDLLRRACGRRRGCPSTPSGERGRRGASSPSTRRPTRPSAPAWCCAP
jgi:hypothetical protein